jgi:DNA topoisomerase-1
MMGADVGDSDVAVAMVAKQAGLVLASPDDLTVERRRDGKDFIYVKANGQPVRDERMIKRFRSLAVPPAYEEVRLAANARAHLQAVGRDEAGRLQYRYHPKWNEVRENLKVERLASALKALPKIRAAASRDLSRRALDRRKALAAAVSLLDATHMRVGCEQYARKNKSFGIATLQKRHIDIRHETLSLSFVGKGGKDITCMVRSPRLVRALARMVELPGRRLLKYRDEGGRIRNIRAEDINAYLSEIAGLPVTAKDLRGLGACAAAAEQLIEIDPAETESRQRRQIAEVMRGVSERLANTPAIVRKSYVHAVVVEGFRSGALRQAYEASRGRAGVRRVERALRALVDQHSASETAG